VLISQRRFPGINRASLTRSAARKQCSAFLLNGFTPWVYAGLFRPPGEDAADPGSALGIAEILLALPLSFPLP